MESNRKLYLRESRARWSYMCAICSSRIPRGTIYYRDEPFPMARIKGEAEVRYLCFSCVTGNSIEEAIARMRSHPIIESISDEHQLILPFGEEAIIHRTRVQLINVTSLLIERILDDYNEIYNIGAENFEYVIQDRLFAMGMESERIGHTFRKDGGIDLIFWPRPPYAIPFLGAAQLKHHSSPNINTGPGVVREMIGVLHTKPINFGIIVTNTSFTPDAEWAASEVRSLIRLRDMRDLKRWVASNFTDDAEWREMPSELVLCPGVKIDLTRNLFSGRKNA